MTTSKSKIQTAVKQHLSSRLRAQNLKGKARLKEEASFIAGASAALHAVFGDGDSENASLTDYVPPKWIVSIMTGRSILDEG
jgi:hypothetical protein